MRRPWHIWMVFLLCLAAVIPAMGWLSMKTMELDALRETDRVETEKARREAELQELISSALYRMDLKLLPLVAQEASRPHYLYQSFYQIINPVVDSIQPPSSEFADVPSPLLFQPPEFVTLHFQIGSDGQITSPQLPVGDECQLAMSCCGVTPTSLDLNMTKLGEANKFCNYDLLILKCPEIKLPQMGADAVAQQKAGTFPSVYSVPAIEEIGKQIIDSQIGDGLKRQSHLNNKSEIQRSRGKDRYNTEFNRRRDSTKGFAGQQWANNNMNDNQLAHGQMGSQSLLNWDAPTKPGLVREGVMQPMWIGENLILARRVDGNENPVIQCCWLDWNAIQIALKAEVEDLLPVVEFQPVKEDNDLILGTALTTIPVQLVVDSSQLLSTLAIDLGQEDQSSSGLKLSLLVAWCGLGLTAFASALLLYGVMRLSERRAAFVSAVTHELRTPLTTFRMYAEMLSERMVPEGKQQEYAHTLKVESDRLSHLVENVLQFARLERGAISSTNESLTVDELMSRFSSRLIERARHADMKLTIDIDDTDSKLTLKTQPAVIEQVIFNLVDNACKYAKPSSNNRIEISFLNAGNSLKLCVRDFGPGVAPKYKKRMFQAFCKSDQDAANSAQGVGLGLALCRRMAASLGGQIIHEECGNGAMFVLEIPHRS